MDKPNTRKSAGNKSVKRPQEDDSDGPLKFTLRKMLEEKVFTDFIIVSSDGLEFPCHKSIISIQVPYIPTEFTNEKSWKKVNRLSIQANWEMNADVVIAFLRYIYYYDTSGMKNNIKITCSMIKIGQLCKLNDLIDIAIGFLSEYEDDQFRNELNELGKLQQFARKWDDGHQHKKKLCDLIVKIVAAIFEIPTQT